MLSLSKVIKLRFSQNFQFNSLLQYQNLLSFSYIYRYTDNFVKKMLRYFGGIAFFLLR